MRQYQEAAFRAAFLVLRDAAEAEDAAQEAMVKAYRALHRFRTGALRPWLLKIVMNEALNRLTRILNQGGFWPEGWLS